uniref:Beta-phosphoglucomutase n=1 Tax=Tetraselmis sp. GSL018 TaxID=582737 RepID=A0A061S7L8_9CHLO|eukprot:CAMPEP_0177592596 /NCGR_PEP_ID=MMETSP0419_2-20121207/8649_1 /TAXON_ID=582737 /ORGANISM="Tetraselmis sp., Strain GSL018" /LENGTH=286 /DNA_ID=CAMNT_0019083483 /DNA_START=61 /DNA_END=921 /DNA_ORIENTATION=-
MATKTGSSLSALDTGLRHLPSRNKQVLTAQPVKHESNPIGRGGRTLSHHDGLDFEVVKAVLFDIDGTLCNSDPLHFKVFQEALQKEGFNNGLPIDETFFRRNISGRHNPDILAELFPEWTAEKANQFAEDKEAAFRCLAGSTLCRMPGLTEFLGWLEETNRRKVAVTNAPRSNAQCMLDALDLSARFEQIIIGAECACPKPAPDPYIVGLNALAVQPSEAIAIEDSPSGIRAAVAAGIPTVGILSGQEAATLRTAGARWLIRDFKDLMDVIYKKAPEEQGTPVEMR